MDQPVAEPAADAAPELLAIGGQRLVRNCLLGVFLILLAGALHLSAGFSIPVMLALLLYLVLSPMVRSADRLGIAPWITGAVIVFALLSVLFFSAYFLMGPAARWIEQAPATIRDLQVRLDDILRPMRVVEQATESVAEPELDVQKVVVQGEGPLSKIATGAPGVIAGTGLTVFLLYFLLASGSLFHAKLVRVLPTMSDKKRALRIAYDVERQISRYLFTITLINIGLGCAVAGLMALLEMPNPLLLGTMAGLLNYIPYVGGVVGSALAGLIAFATFGSVLDTAVVMVGYALLNAMEGYFITPAVVGRRLELNAVVVLVSVAFWGWLWGIIGALMAVPILVVVKIFADNIDGMRGLGEFLSARDAGPFDVE